MNGRHDMYLAKLVRDGFFRVDPDGSIWRLARLSRSGRVLRLSPRRAERRHSQGYLRVGVSIKKTDAISMAHRLVWVVANGAIPAGLEINHKNGNKSDNRLTNLELVTPRENMRHAYDVLNVEPLRGERVGTAKLSLTLASEIRNRFAEGETIRSLARAFGVGRPQIDKVLSGERWNAVPRGVETTVATGPHRTLSSQRS